MLAWFTPKRLRSATGEPPPQLSSSPTKTDAIVAVKDITTPLDFWVHLEESFKCTENLQRQSASELKDIHLILGQLAQMVSQGLNLASDAGLAIRHVNKFGDGIHALNNNKTPSKKMSEGTCQRWL